MVVGPVFGDENLFDVDDWYPVFDVGSFVAADIGGIVCRFRHLSRVKH